jgi:hypothetical protein
VSGQDLRRRLVADVDRVRLYMVATIADARRVGAEVPVEVTASTKSWRSWADRLSTWAEEVARRRSSGVALAQRVWDSSAAAADADLAMVKPPGELGFAHRAWSGRYPQSVEPN